MAETTASTLGFPFSDEYILFLNDRLANLHPSLILQWAAISLPNLYQTTAFGLTGLVTADLLSRLPSAKSTPIPLVFIDTLYHFNETIDLANRVAQTYNVPLHIYKPHGCTSREDFESLHGQKLWETDPDVYDYLVKVEPARRSYEELNVRAVITGRRRSQKGERQSIPIIELDRTSSPPIIKLNPLASWDYNQVWSYIKENNVPYNALHDKGYKSIGDVHSTRPTREGENERDGRWAGQQKTECGLHKDYLKMRASYMAAKKRKAAVDDDGAATTDPSQESPVKAPWNADDAGDIGRPITAADSGEVIAMTWRPKKKIHLDVQ
ncbi:phosphoadenosine phosphosulfate reductase [Cladochytrium replicatum]|nr:phosphoadenosine phosphosulfate reductase [Cladochytrium replicatum]